ncbi:MAG: hypothetical protein CBC22_06795 [Alphaproteobacteria bacterium TMED62]|nr:MAG: hypothetical protein CBC22_06795 [Alphaproteobacteria bacterium TMED62]|tara:strand:+ start:6093 stop:7163 length:1071 start_codon:yes stop_codon:yes gene_type:complete
MTAIEKIIIKNIKSNGSLSLEEYLTIVLYHQKYGYYSKKNIIGKSGDFITSPEISQVFGELIASWIIFNSSNFFKNKFNFLELGPGRAVLIQDILRTIKSLNNKLYNNIENIYFLEKSIEFKNYQKNIKKSKIISDIEEVEHKEFFALANEFFDAIPVNQYVKMGKFWYEKRVCLNKKNRLSFNLSNYPTKKNLPFPLTDKEGFVFEYSTYTHLLLSDIFKRISSHGGVFLIIDYAKNKNFNNSTLSCIYKHTHVSPFFAPGLTDISIKPDFNFIKSLALQYNCKVIGPLTQSSFLTKLGIELRFEQLIKSNPTLSFSLQSSKKRLINKEYMGEIFKVLIITNKKYKDLIFDNDYD